MNKKKTDDVFGDLASFSTTPKPLSIEEQRMAKQNSAQIASHQKETTYQLALQNKIPFSNQLSHINGLDQKSITNVSPLLQQVTTLSATPSRPGTPASQPLHSKSQYTIVPGAQQGFSSTPSNLQNGSGFTQNGTINNSSPMKFVNQYNNSISLKPHGSSPSSTSKLPYVNQSDVINSTPLISFGSTPNSAALPLSSTKSNLAKNNDLDLDFLGSFANQKTSAVVNDKSIVTGKQPLEIDLLGGHDIIEKLSSPMNSVNSNSQHNSSKKSIEIDLLGGDGLIRNLSTLKKSDQVDLLGVFDIPENFAGAKKPVEVVHSSFAANDDILGALSGPAVVKTKAQNQVEQKTDINMFGEDIQRSQAKLSQNSAINQVGLVKDTNSNQPDNSLQCAIDELVKMGFDRELSKKTLLENNRDIQKSVDSILNPKPADSPEIEELLKMGFKRPQCLQALEITNGNLESAIEYLLNKPNRNITFDHKPEVNVAEVAQQFGISVLSKAKNVFNYSKKKVDLIVNGNSLKEVEPSDWNNPKFKDDFYQKEANIIHSQNDFKAGVKPYSPSQRDEELEAPLKKKAPVKVVEMDLLSIDSNKTNLFSAELKNEVTFLASKPIEKPVSFSHKEKLPIISDTFNVEADEFRNQGNELFKQGQFGDAEEKYTKGISMLPKNHSQLIPLLNNRAACRLKNGDYKGSIQDCDYIINLQDDLKALLRRAMAYEALEDWANARDDYKRIMTIDASVKGCSLGLARCISALTPKEPTSVAIKSNRIEIVQKSNKTSASVEKQVTKAVDEAVHKLRTQNLDQEKLETEKFQLHDKVNFKVNISNKIDQWKNNKETNIRALISSLETVLWEDLGWKKVGLHELVQTNQVKIKYLKAVGKVHPDKVFDINKLGKCSVEEGLIASGVFTVLNKAWDAFKVSNNL